MSEGVNMGWRRETRYIKHRARSDREEHVKCKLTGSVCRPQTDGLDPVRLDGISGTEEVFYAASNIESAFCHLAPGQPNEMVGESEWVSRDYWPVADIWGIWASNFEASIKYLGEVRECPPIVQGDIWIHSCG